MVEKTIYLDFNATVLPVPGVREAICHALNNAGNPSSVHFYGQRAKKKINAVRQKLASMIEANHNDIYFTGSGTQANAMVMGGVQSSFVITSSIEHASIFENLTFYRPGKYKKIPVSEEGIISLECLEQALKEAPKPCLVSVMLANNETGAIQPIKKVVQICKKYGAWVHTDAIQAFGKIPVSFKDLGVDIMTLSSHKAGGPQGVGIFVKKKEVPFNPLYVGGGQERGVHHGTENLLGISGFSAALDALDLTEYKKLAKLRDQMESYLQKQVANLKIPSQKVDRLPNTSYLCMPGINKSLQLMALDLSGISVSSGAACSSGKVEGSKVLEAMGYQEKEAQTALRISLGWSTTEEEVALFAKEWLQIYDKYRADTP